jgi:hypothetical protein
MLSGRIQSGRFPAPRIPYRQYKQDCLYSSCEEQ